MPKNFLQKDFDNLKDFLKNKNLIQQDESEEIITSLKHIHEVCYSFAIWDHSLSKIKYDGRVFLKEIRSDAIQTIPLLLMGYKKSTGILLRSIIESSLKHIYFIDHPVEFIWITTKNDYFKSMASLYDYIQSHPLFSDINRQLDVRNELKQRYDKYSKLVHTQNVSYMQLFKSLSCIKRDEQFIEEYEKDFVSNGNTINLMFGIYHKKKFNDFDNFFKNTILSCMNKKTKQIFHGIS